MRVFGVAASQHPHRGTHQPDPTGGWGDSVYYYLVKAEFYNYYLVKAEFYNARTDVPAAQAYYDSARAVLEARLTARPAGGAAQEEPPEVELAWAYAALGRKADAIRLARSVAQAIAVSRDAFAGPRMIDNLVAVNVRTGEYEAALDQLEYLVTIPSLISVPLPRVDPLYASLRGNPRFERLLIRK